MAGMADTLVSSTSATGGTGTKALEAARVQKQHAAVASGTANDKVNRADAKMMKVRFI